MPDRKVGHFVFIVPERTEFKLRDVISVPKCRRSLAASCLPRRFVSGSPLQGLRKKSLLLRDSRDFSFMARAGVGCDELCAVLPFNYVTFTLIVSSPFLFLARKLQIETISTQSYLSGDPNPRLKSIPKMVTNTRAHTRLTIWLELFIARV